MTRRARILVVDDSVVIRKVVCAALADDPRLEVLTAATNGPEALGRMAKEEPDVVILDVQMPGMNGLNVLRCIRADFPHVHVLILSSLSGPEAKTTARALSLGASACLRKPVAKTIEEGRMRLKEELLPIIAQLIGPSSAPRTRQATNKVLNVATLAPQRPTRSFQPSLIVIGASTGGPPVLHTILRAVPKRPVVPIIVAQHMPPGFTAHLAARLNDRCPPHVVEANGDQALERSGVFIGPGSYNICVRRRAHELRLCAESAGETSDCRPSVDALFETASTALGSAVLGIVLSGMGEDGLAGAAAIKRGGGRILVQDEASSAVWGMPGAIVHAGLADEVLSIPELARALTHACHEPAARLAGGAR